VIPVDWFDDEFIAEGLKEDAKPNLELKKTVGPLKVEYGQVGDKIRNEHICQNISTAIEGTRGKRVMVVFGLDHKYFLNDCLEKAGNRILPVEELVSTKNSEYYQVDAAIKREALKNISAAKALLQKQLRENFYKGLLKERLGNKLKSFDQWISTVSAL
jgi:hypothetical protein